MHDGVSVSRLSAMAACRRAQQLSMDTEWSAHDDCERSVRVGIVDRVEGHEHMLMRQPLALETSIDLGHAHAQVYSSARICSRRHHGDRVIEVDLCLNADMDLAWQRLAED